MTWQQEEEEREMDVSGQVFKTAAELAREEQERRAARTNNQAGVAASSTVRAPVRDCGQGCWGDEDERLNGCPTAHRLHFVVCAARPLSAQCAWGTE